ncbi:hypothetical protein DAERI_020223 [Deinococcus aerius]|uniref:Uncharacterized protein n=2 Tax=Deinococcus TaxID=1298 RepID=A0A2I9D2D2_9DEIO|nr:MULTISPECIES: hypothetical protein [Deinococcus]MBB5293915.1 hypothetical protein [Deinococcus metallilatus]QBY07146.1 hypothetical protein E5F05_03955 [Deinococcus metallilatus]RXJ14618.1 hypothetical protein ERJ73_02685 [Deinococcus metallilatus]TLK30738.1 hypothetical protein FCS05_03000 [Deinococcus metallilatus]GBF04626.1 hypothetical protein DAERI_020223 [Deinococcus aerius]
MTLPRWARFVQVAALPVEPVTHVGLLALGNGLGGLFLLPGVVVSWMHRRGWPLRFFDLGCMEVGLS